MKQSHIHFFRAISHKFNFATSSSNSDKAATGLPAGPALNSQTILWNWKIDANFKADPTKLDMLVFFCFLQVADIC